MDKIKNKDNKKIIFFYSVGWFFFSHRFDYAKFLQKNNWHVTVASHFNNEQILILKRNKINYVTIGDNRNTNLVIKIINIFQIRKIIINIEPNLIEFASHSMNVLGIISTLFLKYKCIFWITGMGSFFIKKNYLNILIQRIILLIYKLNYHNKKKYILIENSFDRDNLIKKNIVKKNQIYLVFGPGVDENYFSAKNDYSNLNNKDRNIILFPSRLIRDKGVMDFYYVAKHFYKNKINNYKFVLLGKFDPSNPSTLNKKEIEKINTLPNLENAGFVKDIREHLEKTIIVCFPSHREGLPKALIEALMMNVPVIAYDVPGCNELIINSKNGILIPPGKISLLSTTLERILQNEKKLKAFSKQARFSVINKCSSNKIFNILLKIYINIVSN